MEVIVARIAGLDVHKETVMACVRVPGRGGQTPTGGPGVLDLHGRAGPLEGLASRRRGDPGGDGSHRGLLAAGLACLGGRAGMGADAGERPPREEPARAQDRRVGLGVAGSIGRVRVVTWLVSCRRLSSPGCAT